MNMPRVKNEISVGTISSWVGLALLLVSAGGGWAAINARVDAGEAADAAQNIIIKELTDDRNAMAQVLAEIRVDVGYLRRAEEEARRQARAGQ